MISALPVMIKKQSLDKAYRIYVTDALKIIGENTARYAGGSYMKIRYFDIEEPKPRETRTPEEIITHMKQKIASA